MSRLAFFSTTFVRFTFPLLFTAKHRFCSDYGVVRMHVRTELRFIDFDSYILHSLFGQRFLDDVLYPRSTIDQRFI